MSTAAAPRSAVVAAPRRQRSRRRLLTGGLSLAVSVAVLAALLIRIDLGATLNAAQRASWLALAGAIALNIPCTLLRARRAQLLVDRVGVRVPIGRMTLIGLAGQALSWLTPAASGDLVRAYLWRRTDGVPVRDGVSVVVYERVVSFVLMLAVGGIAGGFVLASAAGVVPYAVAGLALLVVIGIAAAWLRRRAPLGPARLPERFAVMVARFGELVASPLLALRFTLITLVILLLSGLQIVLLTTALDVPVPIWVGMAAYCLSQAAGSISGLPFGIGVTDAVVVGLLVAAGVDAPEAAAAMVLTRLTVTLPLGAAGAGAYLLLGRLVGRNAARAA